MPGRGRGGEAGRRPTESREDLPGRVRARLYDVVLNGNELGSGSIRIHRPDVQERVLERIGLTPAEAQEKFGFLIDAFRFGAPPHGGIGMGLDRIVMLMGDPPALPHPAALPCPSAPQPACCGSSPPCILSDRKT